MESSKKSIIHFGVLINNNKKYLKINREEYAKIDKKNHSLSISKKQHERMKLYANYDEKFYQEWSKSYFDNYLKVFEDETLTTYTDNYCIKHQKDCLINYDLNMKFFNEIKYGDFERIISKLIRKFKKLREIKDLNSYEGKGGIYILILDEYKQIYIGQSNDIKKRILQHWTRRKEFFKLIFGKKETSVLSIDSFGALDTTRIFIYEIENLYEQLKIEEKITDYIPKEYLLNRTKGGDRGLLMNEIVVNTLGTMNKRQLL